MKSDHRPLPGGRLRAIRIPSLLRMLARDRRGNIVIPLAICVALMVLIVGAGIDFARGYNAKVSLQAAVDATALAANYDSNGLSDGKIRQNAVDYFNSIYTPPPGATPASRCCRPWSDAVATAPNAHSAPRVDRPPAR